jgi:hypothetical protein
VETPVPIPNTVVKHLGPMIVRVLAKVGIAIFINPLPGHLGKGFFLLKNLCPVAKNDLLAIQNSMYKR